MNIFRRLIILTIGLLLVSSIYAYFLVNDRESRRNTLQIAEVNQLTGDQQQGKYVATMGGCIVCHTNYAEGGSDLAGGVPIETPFGTFFSPNITSDKTAGIGQWTTAEFLTAMTVGVSPDNEHYYPSFPYTSYSVMTEQDLVDLKAWLDTVPPISTQAPTHDIQWPVSWRMGLTPWKALFFDPLRKANKEDRGQYLVEVGHCAECHSPRNIIGSLNNRSLSGNTYPFGLMRILSYFSKWASHQKGISPVATWSTLLSTAPGYSQLLIVLQSLPTYSLRQTSNEKKHL